MGDSVDVPGAFSYDSAMGIIGVASFRASPRRVRLGVTCALIIAISGAVILPILAPAIDHHALEKLPDHGHIYPGGVPLDHSHAHETTHAHGDEAASTPESGIIFLPPNDDTTGVSSLNVIPAVLTLSLAILIPLLSVRVRLTWNSLLDLFTPPVETPPPQSVL